MSTQRRSQAHRENENLDLALLANGSSGGWDVSVDETTSDPTRWFIQIESPTAYCNFEVRSPEMVHKVLDFLEGHEAPEHLHARSANNNGSLVLGKYPKTPVILIRDDEYSDRYFLVIGPDAALVRLSIAGKDLKALTEALRQAVEDLECDK
jgi:hypothetical protein